MKKIITSILLLFMLVGCSGKGSLMDVYSGVTLIATGIVVAENYGTVESIVMSNINLFNETEKAKLKAASETFNEMFITIKNITGQSNTMSNDEIIIQLAQIDYIWIKVKTSYTVSKKIIDDVKHKMSMDEQILIARFEHDAELLSVEMSKLNQRINEGVSMLTGGEQIDITALLQDIALFASAISKIIAITET